MPTYEYECLSCKTRFERMQRFSDPPVAECPECSGAVRRVLHPAGIVFKGSGWYITDSRKPAAGESTTGGAEASPKPDGAVESKTETPAAAKTGENGKGEKSAASTSSAAKADA